MLIFAQIQLKHQIPVEEQKKLDKKFNKFMMSYKSDS